MRGKARRVLLLIAVIAAAVAGYRWWTGQAVADTGGLSASGTVEATDITVASDAVGRVTAVLAAEGDTVHAGQVLVQLDDSLLKAQREQAQASLAAARGSQAAAEASVAASQAQLDQLRAGAREQEVAAAQQAVAAAQGQESAATSQLAQARAAQRAAVAQRNKAVAAYAQVKQGARQEVIDAAAVAYQQAEAAVRIAQSDYDKIAGSPNAGQTAQALALERATLAMEAAKSNYQGVLSGATTPELDQARAAVDGAVAGIIQASAAVSQTEAAVDTASAGLAAEQARLDLVKAGSRPEQIKAAEAQVEAARAQTEAASGQVAAAQAAVALVDRQIARYQIASPTEGVVLARVIEPGEVALSGGTLMSLGDLQRLTLTVYLPEDKYGQVSVGDQAQVTVDSHPGQAFVGTVQHIADEAEFTPRNVQTPAGRRTTVFAVKLSLDNPQGRLKPGMPADVRFAR